MEKIDEIGFGGLKLLQETDDFCYGIDAVLLADFAACRKYKDKSIKICDLGSGNGVVPLILSAKLKGAHITGIEKKEATSKLAEKSIAINGLENRIEIINSDILKITSELDGIFDVVTMNPPYVKRDGGITSVDKGKMIARQETTATIDDFFAVAASLLKDKGEISLVHRPNRLVDVLTSARTVGVEAKEMRMVVPYAGKKPNLVLIRLVKGGGSDLDVLPELAVRGEDGEYTSDVKNAYFS